MWNWRSYYKTANIFLPSGPSGDRGRGRIYESHLKACGLNFKVADQAFVYSPERLSVGNHVYIGFGSYLGNGDISLGDEVLIGNHVSVTASNHRKMNNSFRFGGVDYSPVSIGRGTWLGAHSCVLAGVTIGSGSLVAAGAVVTKSFGNGVLLAGVPARVIRELDEHGN